MNARDSDLMQHPGAVSATGKVDPAAKIKLDALPFTRMNEQGGRCWWHVTETGDYAADFERGRDYAQLVLPLLKYNVGGPLLGWIVADMIKKGPSRSTMVARNASAGS